MLLLALDTSTRQGSVALCTEEMLLGEYTWQVGNNHSVELLERIQSLVKNAGTAHSALDGVAVATGPGSFNGVRVAVATAKTLAYTLRVPLVGVPTLDIIAAQQRWAGPVCALQEAGRAELYAACYTCEENSQEGILLYSMQRLSDYLLESPARLVEQLKQWVGVPGERALPAVLFCGEFSEASRQAIFERMEEQSIFASSLDSTRHASTLAALALPRFAQGALDDPLRLEPLYLRRPSITTSARKQPLLGNRAQRRTTDETEREEGAVHH
jgi:tRNA threonylcarbamoyladenosine biosynthesis protein TsaB